MNYSPKVHSNEYIGNPQADKGPALHFRQSPAPHVVVDQASLQERDAAEGVHRAIMESSANNEASSADEAIAKSMPMPDARIEVTTNVTTRPMSLNVADHPQGELIVMLSSLLTKITYSNDNIHSGPEPASPLKPNSPLLAFHARNIPSISIQSYLTRILKYCPMSSDIFLSLLVYFDRMSQIATDEKPVSDSATFTSTKQLMGDEQHPLSIDSYNVHRLVITGILVASKFCSDVFYTNSRYAKVGGLPLSELNHLEFQFLLMNDFRLMIPMEELQKYGDQLLNFWQNESASRAHNG